MQFAIVCGVFIVDHSNLFSYVLLSSQVCLRSDYKDDWDTFEFDQLRYLADPPEKKWMVRIIPTMSFLCSSVILSISCDSVLYGKICNDTITSILSC